MYRPDLFRVDDVPQMHALMRARPFAALISNGAAGLYASHLPTVLKDAGPTSDRVPSRAGQSALEGACRRGESLTIFQGPERSSDRTSIRRKPSTGRSFRPGTSRLFMLTDVPKPSTTPLVYASMLPNLRRSRNGISPGPGHLRTHRRLYQRYGAGHRRLPLRYHAARRQVEDEPESRNAGPSWRR